MADAVADDGGRLSRSEVSAKIKEALATLRSIATTGDAQVDDEMLQGEQALRRAVGRLSRMQ